MRHDSCVLVANLNRIRSDSAEYSKNPEKVTLLAVSKYATVEEIQTIFEQGIDNFAENFIQAAVKKIKRLPNKITWHYTDALQSNKLKAIVQNFDWVHSLSSLRHASKLNSYCRKLKKSINVLIQINIDMDPQKNGIMPDDQNALSQLLLFIAKESEHLKLKGFSCMLENTSNPELQRRSFMKMNDLQADIEQNMEIKTEYLSMGTSSDIKAALLSGSTIVRVGRAIFGQSFEIK